jgi:hypothetical protein
MSLSSSQDKERSRHCQRNTKWPSLPILASRRGKFTLYELTVSHGGLVEDSSLIGGANVRLMGQPYPEYRDTTLLRNVRNA